MGKQCNLCGKFIASTDCAKCAKCAGVFHRGCAKIGSKTPISIQWECRDCRIKNKQLSCSPETDNSDEPLDDTEVEQKSVDALVRELKLLRCELVTVASEMASFRLEMARLNSTVSEFNCRIDKVEDRLTNLEARPCGCSGGSEGETQEVISQLRSDLNDKEQEHLLNDVMVAGIEERSGENLAQILNLISTKIGFNLDERDVVFAERTGPRRAAVEGAERARPRPIAVRFTRRTVRDDMLRSARVRRGADSTGITDGPLRRFYVNERLTRTNAQLFYKVREEGHQKGWKFIWTNGGRIFIRKDANAPAFRIKSEKEIQKFFGQSTI